MTMRLCDYETGGTVTTNRNCDRRNGEPLYKLIERMRLALNSRHFCLNMSCIVRAVINCVLTVICLDTH